MYMFFILLNVCLVMDIGEDDVWDMLGILILILCNVYR